MERRQRGATTCSAEKTKEETEDGANRAVRGGRSEEKTVHSIKRTKCHFSRCVVRHYFVCPGMNRRMDGMNE